MKAKVVELEFGPVVAEEINEMIVPLELAL